MGYRVFISHSTEDKGLAREIAKVLEESGKEVVPSSDPFDSLDSTVRIPRKIRTADEVILLLTKNSSGSSNVLYELGVAKGMGKRVTAVLSRLRDDEVPEMVRQEDTIRYRDLDSFAAEILERAESS